MAEQVPTYPAKVIGCLQHSSLPERALALTVGHYGFLRLYPAASHTKRVLTQDDVLPLKFPIRTTAGEVLTSIRIKKDQVCGFQSPTINQNITVWGPDGHDFKPERWLDPSTLPAPPSLPTGRNWFFTFFLGTNMCLGVRFGKYRCPHSSVPQEASAADTVYCRHHSTFESNVILATLIKRFEFSQTNETI